MLRGARGRSTRLAAALAATALLATACVGGDGGDDGGDGDTAESEGSDEASSGTFERLQEKGSITIGIADEEPYGYVDEEGNVTGEAPEVARVVLGEMGIDEVEAEVVDFGALISGLQAEQFDMVAAGMYINQERANQILFSDPDYCVGEAFAVPEGNPADLEDFQSVVDSPDVTIAILSSAVEEGYAETAGVPDDQIELFNDVNAQYDALQAGRVDAVTGTVLAIQHQVDDREGFQATESFFPLDEDGEEIRGCGGFGFRNEDQAFRDAFNEELNRLQDEGELLPIIAAFGFAEEDIERAQDLTVEDLTGESEDSGDSGDSEGESGASDAQGQDRAESPSKRSGQDVWFGTAYQGACFSERYGTTHAAGHRHARSGPFRAETG